MSFSLRVLFCCYCYQASTFILGATGGSVRNDAVSDGGNTNILERVNTDAQLHEYSNGNGEWVVSLSFRPTNQNQHEQ